MRTRRRDVHDSPLLGSDPKHTPQPTHMTPTAKPLTSKPAPPSLPDWLAGIGMLCGDDRGNAIQAVRQLAGLIDWVAFRPENTTLDDVAEARGLGMLAHVWEAQAAEGQAAVDRLGATGYIAQHEGWGQHHAAIDLSPKPAKRALVSAVSFLEDKPWPEGWACIPEAYANANPQQTPDVMEAAARQRGATEVAACFGLYDASSEQPGVGGRVPLADYLHQLGRNTNWSGYTAETFVQVDADVQLLRLLRERRAA